MSKSKTDNSGVSSLPKSPFVGFSRFGNQKNQFGREQKFNPKSVISKPVFITHHKGGGGK